MGALAVAGDITNAAAALSGLILVFLGTAVAGFDSYEELAKKSVRQKYQVRAWLAVGGLASALAALGLSLGAKGGGSEPVAWLAVVALIATAVLILTAALLLALDVR